MDYVKTPRTFNPLTGCIPFFLRSREAGKQGSREAGKQGSREAGKQGSREAGKQGSREAGILINWLGLSYWFVWR
jgi:hypothetical protein